MMSEKKNTPDGRILSFIKKHHVMTLATSLGDEPWTAHCFYAYMSKENLLVFTSGADTKHMQMIKDNDRTAVGIALETRVVGKIQGVQMQGRVYRPNDELAKKSRKRYLRRFPYARLMETTIWVFEPYMIKMTHNALGFGKKLFWQK